MDGFNYYPLNISTISESSMRDLFSSAQKKGVKVFRFWLFDQGKPPSNSAGNLRYLSGSTLLWREAQWVHVDMIADLAREYGLKLYPCLADNTPNYDTKATYVTWANAVYSSGLSTSYPYTGFFDSADCRTILKELIFEFANRVNTINGRVYKEDPTWNFLDIGNEMRYDVFDAEGGTQNTTNSTNIIKVLDWMEDIAGYSKSIAPNILVSCGGAEHTWNWVQGDTVSNGSGYGRDYRKEALLTNIDFVDIHCYPNQGGTELLKYGQRLGYPDAISGAGFRAQLRDYVTAVKATMPVIMGELGFDKNIVGSTTYFPLNPRSRVAKEIMDEWYGAGADGVIWWHAATSDSGSYDVNIKGYGGLAVNSNSDDRPLMSVITRRIHYGKRIPISAE